MSNVASERVRWSNAHRQFGAHVATMPTWHKLVLVLGLLMALGGGVGWLLTSAGHNARPQATSGGAPNRQRFIDNTGTGSADDAPSVGLLGRISPHATSIG